MAESFEKYGAMWAAGYDLLQLEFDCIQRKGHWRSKTGKECGLGLFHHYKEAQKLLWPDDYHHRWSDLELQEILNNTITVITGPKDTGKTHVALVRYGLTDYFAHPDNTLIIVSSTTLAALEGRVWGDMKSMFQKAKNRYEWLPGFPLESKHAICTDDLGDEEEIKTRDMRKGILCVACKNSAGQHLSIASYVGMKQERRRHLGDEFQFMSVGMMESIANMNSGEYKGIFVGNPIGQDDPLDKLSEPEEGWEAHREPTTTTTWKNRRFLNSRTLCLYGLDSPNITDTPKNQYRGLLTENSIERVIAGYGKDSHHYYSQCLGIRKSGLNARRVITKALCREHHAFDEVVWEGSRPTIKIAACDAAYGGSGGDRCVAGHVEFGKDVSGKLTLLVHPPSIVPISLRNTQSPEDQISAWVKFYCESHLVPPENFFFDSTGRGSLGPSLARIWSNLIQPVEFGGAPTERPVSLDTYIFDEKKRTRRLQTCREAYFNFVTELWWTTRLVIESGQMRGLPENVADEGCAREWKLVAGNRVQIEPKSDMRDRCGYSPDNFDWLVTAVEGARRRGLAISKLANESSRKRPQDDYLAKLARSQREMIAKKQLINA